MISVSFHGDFPQQKEPLPLLAGSWQAVLERQGFRSTATVGPWHGMSRLAVGSALVTVTVDGGSSAYFARKG